MYMEDRQTKDVKTLVQMMTVMMEVMTRVKAQMTGLRGAGGWRRHAACSQDWLEGCPRVLTWTFRSTGLYVLQGVRCRCEV